jgi:hypothetical protein
MNFLIETRSPPGLARSYPRHFTFYVARWAFLINMPIAIVAGFLVIAGAQSAPKPRLNRESREKTRIKLERPLHSLPAVARAC